MKSNKLFLFFDPLTQVGNPTLLLIERLFYLGIEIFFVAAILSSFVTKEESKEKDK